MSIYMLFKCVTRNGVLYFTVLTVNTSVQLVEKQVVTYFPLAYQ